MTHEHFSSLPRELFEHCADPVQEDGRLFGGNGPLELERTKHLIARYLPPVPQVVRDVGGGTGVYSHWLAGLGYETHLLDAVPSLVEMAINKIPKGRALASAQVGDARDLPWPDNSSDLVVLLGPLYHLIEKHEPSSPNFTTAYFHDPGEFVEEIEESEFLLEDFVGIEGPGWLAPNFSELWSDLMRRAQILGAAESLERRSDVMGMNKQLMAVGRKQL